MPEHDDRQHFIPIRKQELVDLICADSHMPDAAAEPFRRFCELLAATFHFEYHSRLEALKSGYAPFDPDADTKPLFAPTPEEKTQRLSVLFDEFGRLMERANYAHMARAVIEEAIARGSSDWGLNMEVDFSIFERLEIYYRGEGETVRKRRRARNFWRIEHVTLPVYNRLILILKLRPHKRVPKNVDTNTVFVKVFKDIPKIDLEMLLPGARIMMPGLQRFKLGGSFVGTLGFVGYKIANVMPELIQGALMRNPFAFWGPVSLVFGYGYKQYYGFQQTRVNYTLMLTESLYFQNLDNNGGVFTRLIDEAEEQECREAILAYYCLWRFADAEGWTEEQLDEFVEAELERRANVKVDFEVDDALAKLVRLGLVEQRGERYRAIPLPRALECLDEAWDNYFRYANEARDLAKRTSA